MTWHAVPIGAALATSCLPLTTPAGGPDALSSVAQQALVAYEKQFVDVKKALFEPNRYLWPASPVSNLAPEAARRALVDICLGRSKLTFVCGNGVPLALNTARRDDPEMGSSLTIVGLERGRRRRPGPAAIAMIFRR